jgi:hypothetical protein
MNERVGERKEKEEDACVESCWQGRLGMILEEGPSV